jgi:uncharacterized protein (DUF486 family)
MPARYRPQGGGQNDIFTQTLRLAEPRRLRQEAAMTAFKTIGLLLLSNIFMTFAWYAHLRDLRSKPLIVAILASWGIALFEYSLQVPANRIGIGVFTLPQLKIIQEVVTLSVFVPFALLYMKTPLGWNYLWASLCLVGAVFFIFRTP